MEVTSVNCNNCGAPLEVGAGTNYVTCRHCGSHLAIKRTASTAYTELLGELDRKTDEIAEKVEVLLQQNELERIDREWEEERKQYLSRDKHGGTHEPSVVGSIVMAAFIGGTGLVMALAVLGGPAPSGFACVGFFIALLAAAFGVYGVNRARRYEEAKARYRQRRAAAAAPKPSPEPEK